MTDVKKSARRSAWVLPGSRRVRSGTMVPGFAHCLALPNLDAEASAVALVDLAHRGPLHGTVLYLAEQGAVRTALEVLERQAAAIMSGYRASFQCDASANELMQRLQDHLKKCWQFLLVCEEGIGDRFAPVLEVENASAPIAAGLALDDKVQEPARRDEACELWTRDVLENLHLRMIGRFKRGSVSVNVRDGRCTWSNDFSGCSAIASVTGADSTCGAMADSSAALSSSSQAGLSSKIAAEEDWYHVQLEIPPRMDERTWTSSYVAALSLPGVTHVLGGGTACQDASWVASHPSGLRVLAVSDGHGSAQYVNSDVGSRLAVSVAHDLLPRVFAADATNSVERLREAARRLGPSVVNEWNRRVRLHREIFSTTAQMDDDALRRVDGGYDDVVRAYGATVLGAAVHDGWMVSMQLGDGDIVRVWSVGDQTQCERVFVGHDKQVDSATASLASRGAARPENFRVEVKRFDEHAVKDEALPDMDGGPGGDETAKERPAGATLRFVLLATDGVSDPYIPADADARAACRQEVFPDVWGCRVVQEIDAQGGFDLWASRVTETVARIGEVSGDDVSLAVSWWPLSASSTASHSFGAAVSSTVDKDRTITGETLADAFGGSTRTIASDASSGDAARSEPTVSRLVDWLANEKATLGSTVWEQWAAGLTRQLVRVESGLDRADIVLALGWDAPNKQASDLHGGKHNVMVDRSHEMPPSGVSSLATDNTATTEEA